MRKDDTINFTPNAVVDVFYIALIVVAAHAQNSSDARLRISTVLDLVKNAGRKCKRMRENELKG